MTGVAPTKTLPLLSAESSVSAIVMVELTPPNTGVPLTVYERLFAAVAFPLTTL